MNVLIINIDHHYRSVYTCSIAAALKKKVPSAQITGFLSSPNDFLTTTNAFSDIHFFDTGLFFDQTQRLRSEEIEIKIQEAIRPVQKTNWDVVINLSANPLGSIFANFLSHKESRGTILDQELVNQRFSDLPSYMLATVPDDYSNFIHFTYLYRSIVRRYEEVTLTSVWERKMSEEFSQYFSELKKRSGKSQLILIDAGLVSDRSAASIEFLTKMMEKLSSHPRFLPMLIGGEISPDHPLVRELQSKLKGEIYCINVANKAQASLLAESSLLITDDLYLKSVADVSMKPSILLTHDLNLNDFAVTNGSLQVLRGKGDALIADNILPLAEQAISSIGSSTLAQMEIYQTINQNQLPLLRPLNGEGNDQYAHWLLAAKFLSTIQDIDLPPVKVNGAIYKQAVLEEKANLEAKNERGLFSLVKGLASADIRSGKPINRETGLNKLAQFLNSEELRN